jgi:hypothetical protein
MSGCPDIALLEQLLQSATPELIDHVTGCLACQGVLALLETHGPGADQTGECARVEVYLAERAVGRLSPDVEAALQAHLADCSECLELAHATPEASRAKDPTA